MSSDTNSNFNAEANVNGFIDKLLEISPKYQAIKIYNEENKNNPNLSRGEKIAYALERRKILKQAENYASTLNFADLLLKDKGKSLENEIPNIDEDWFNYYSDAVKNVSDNEMRTIWGKILAGECENKGSISKKLINIIQTIDSETAKNFSYLCSYSIVFINDDFKEINPVLPKLSVDEFLNDPIIHDFVSSFEINNIDIRDLQIIGLVSYDLSISSVFGYAGYECDAIYYNEKIHITADSEFIPIGEIEFTKYGKELAWLLYEDFHKQKDDKYIEFVKHYMSELEPSIKFSD